MAAVLDAKSTRRIHIRIIMSINRVTTGLHSCAFSHILRKACRHYCYCVVLASAIALLKKCVCIVCLYDQFSLYIIDRRKEMISAIIIFNVASDNCINISLLRLVCSYSYISSYFYLILKTLHIFDLYLYSKECI
jgi:hypothetical protein